MYTRILELSCVTSEGGGKISECVCVVVKDGLIEVKSPFYVFF